MGVSREAIKTENKAWIPGAPDYLMWCVSVTSPIQITDRLYHSEINIDLYKSEYKCIVLAVCHAY